MGAYKYLSELWRRKQSDVMRFLLRIRCWEYRQLPTVHRVSRSSRPAMARRVGYKSKQGYVVYRCKVRRGDRKKKVSKGIVYGKPTNQGISKQKKRMNLRAIAEQRVGRRCKSLRVLNSYWVAQDACHKWYEVICIDPYQNTIRNDPVINWICKNKHKRRECRGKTSAGRKHRGLYKRGSHKATHARPSRRANWKRRQMKRLHRFR